ncbi:MAG: 4Fe-4S dicluster domain-containing protein [Pseudomonadota bacterium]
MDLDLRALNRWNPGEQDFIAHDPERCTGCGACVRVCVARLWSLDRDRAALAHDHKERCLECGACDQVCAARAITFRYPPGGTGVVYEQG